MSDNDEALKKAIETPEDERTDEEWALLANALESDHDHLAEAAHEAGAELAE